MVPGGHFALPCKQKSHDKPFLTPFVDLSALYVDVVILFVLPLPEPVFVKDSLGMHDLAQ